MTQDSETPPKDDAMASDSPTLLDDLLHAADLAHFAAVHAGTLPSAAEARFRAAHARLARKVGMAGAIGKALDAREYVSPLDVARRELTLEINNGATNPEKGSE